MKYCVQYGPEDGEAYVYASKKELETALEELIADGLVEGCIVYEIKKEVKYEVIPIKVIPLKVKVG